MRICIIMAGYGDGGLENHFVELSNGLAKNNDVHVIAHPEMTNRLDKAVTVHPLDLQLSRNNPVILFKLVRKILKINPDIVHAQANKAVAMIAKNRAFLSRKMKLIGTLHNKKKKLSAFDKMDFVIGVSNRVLEHVKNTNKKCIHNGVEIDHERIRDKTYFNGILPKELLTNKNIIVNLGRLVQAKRVDLSIKSVAGMADTCLVIVGDGPERENLEGLCKQLGAKNVHFLGHRSDSIEILSAADICLISSDREGFSYVMLEALMVETPVLTTDVADMKLILPQGYVVETGNHDALKRLIHMSFADTDAVARNYKDVFAWARNNLSTSIMIENVQQVYNSVLNLNRDEPAKSF